MATGTVNPPAERLHLRQGIALGALGVVAFSLTLPATRAAVPTLGVMFVGLGRAAVAGVLAGCYLLASGTPVPRRAEWRSLVIVALGVVFGFPLLAAFAMRSLPAAHGAVVTGLIPSATAVMAVWRTGERPSALFWAGCVAGILAVLAFAAAEGAGRPQLADLVLLLGVAGAALGYAEGTRLTRAWGPGSGVRVISWVMVIGGPAALLVLIGCFAAGTRPDLEAADARAWIGFGYLSIVSAYLGFFPWYAGLARGGVARVGQVQLLQPVLTVFWAVLLLGEPLHARTVVAAFAVILTAAVSVLSR